MASLILAFQLLTVAAVPPAGGTLAETAAPTPEATSPVRPPPAVAQPVAPLGPSPAPLSMEWYGLGLLAIDAAEIFVLTLTIPHTGGYLLWPYAVAYLALPPILHSFLNDNPSAAWSSLQLRLGFPLVGALVGGAIGATMGGTGGLLGPGLVMLLFGMAGTALGGIIAIIADAAFVSWRPARAARAPQQRAASFQWMPVGGVIRGTPFAGLAGTF